MQKRSVNWEDLLTLSVLVRAGSYSAAARELGLTHATVARRLRRLEEAAGVTLLTRRDDGFQLTADGRAALAAADEMEKAASRLTRDLASAPTGVSGRVRITTTEMLGSFFFVPRLAALHEQYPALVVEFRLENRILSLSRRKADLAVRLARPREEGLVTKRLGSMGYGLYMARNHPQLAQSMDSLTAPLPLCSLDELDAVLNELPEGRWLTANLPNARRTLTANSMPALYQAVRSGWGAGLLPCFIANGDEALIPLVAGPLVKREMWLAYPNEYRDVPRCRVAADWLIDAAERGAAMLAGDTTA